MVIPVALFVPILLPNMLNDSYNDNWKLDYISKVNNSVQVVLRVSTVHNIPSGNIKNLSMLGTTDKFTFFTLKRLKKY